MKNILIWLCLTLIFAVTGCAGQPNQPTAPTATPLLQTLQTAPGLQTGEVTYRVTVTDEAGTPVAGVMLNVCDADSCRVLTTDQQGHAAFNGAPYAYKVQTLLTPEGYQPGAEVILNAAGGEFALMLKGK